MGSTLKTFRITKIILNGWLEGMEVVDTHRAEVCFLERGKEYQGIPHRFRVISIEIL